MQPHTNAVIKVVTAIWPNPKPHPPLAILSKTDTMPDKRPKQAPATTPILHPVRMMLPLSVNSEILDNAGCGEY